MSFEQVRKAKSNRLLAIVPTAMAVFMSSLDMNIVNLGLPLMSNGFQASSEIKWVTLGYLLPGIALLPVAGSFSDVVGRNYTRHVGTDTVSDRFDHAVFSNGDGCGGPVRRKTVGPDASEAFGGNRCVDRFDRIVVLYVIEPEVGALRDDVAYVFDRFRPRLVCRA